MTSHPALFGTNGVRGIVNEFLTPELALRLGKAIGTFFDGGKVLVGGDPRLSTPMIKSAVVAGLGSVGCRVHDGGTAPTPALQFTLHQGGYDGGAIITASHNPPEWNGIKAVDADGTELSREQEERIEGFYYEQRFRAARWEDMTPAIPEPGVNERYIEAVLRAVDRAAIAQRSFKVVVDCSNGASCYTAPFLLRRLGCKVVALNAQPDGAFPGHESEPTPENARQLVAAVGALQADLGCIQDGDADRAVFVDEGARYVDGNLALALLGGEAVKRKPGGLVVTPVSTSMAVEDVVKAAGGRVQYTRVGSPTVAHTMKDTGAVFGGEENGGLIFPDHQHVRDGLRSIAAILELMAKTGKPLSSLLATVPRYATIKAKVHCPDAAKQEVLARFAKGQHGRVDTTDGVKVFSDAGWVLVRPSGTELLMRVFAESKSEEAAKRLADESKRQIEALVREVGHK
ncbi:MAG TPA: phosphoglucosamine mutase [Candidatus Thermoplasmatota archaeon]|jgi:phosphomannomutase/phosphoglucomutase|nr:phosphoglucosamine mutase [Candidatus Thermoplasmatota archaeon]